MKSEIPGPINSVVGMLGRFRNATSQKLQNSRANVACYIPGLFLLSMGISLLCAPSMFVALLSGLFLYLGAVALVYGRRVMHGLQKFREVVHQVEARIYIKGQNPQNLTDTKWTQPETQIVTTPDKKTVYH